MVHLVPIGWYICWKRKHAISNLKSHCSWPLYLNLRYNHAGGLTLRKIKDFFLIILPKLECKISVINFKPGVLFLFLVLCFVPRIFSFIFLSAIYIYTLFVPAFYLTFIFVYWTNLNPHGFKQFFSFQMVISSNIFLLFQSSDSYWNRAYSVFSSVLFVLLGPLPPVFQE